MPNQSSSAGHVPQRTCVICRTKTAGRELVRFGIVCGSIVFDLERCLPGRGYYVCDAEDCIQHLPRWLKKRRRKHDRKGAEST